MIPKIIHQIWLGDKSKKPSDMMETWKEKNPTWEYRFWNEDNLPPMRNKEQFDAIPELAGKADILRYELLHRYGGFFIDADSICVNPLDDFFTDNDSFCCWENEKVRPGLMSNGYLAACQNNALMDYLIQHISRLPPLELKSLPNLTAWMIVGPLLLTETAHRKNYSKIRIYPSHYFIPRHYSGVQYVGNDKVYAEQFWGSTETKKGKVGMTYGSY